ncbi:MAG: CRISPR-associated helicase Cas3' [Clostridia bacterium]|nr:CRISPR-associated helicase Cas3' [Clostridia bacterium]
MFFSHIRKDGNKQTVEAHLQGTADLCSSFAAKFSEAERGRLLGLAHDIGKTSYEFQKRLEGGPKVDHSTAGALECAKQNEMFVACCIAGHHGGLQDFGNMRIDPPGAPTLVGRLKKGQEKQIPTYHWKESLPAVEKEPVFRDTFSQSLWTRMLYSCLVDADYLDTEAFMSSGSVGRGNYDSIPELLNRLGKYIEPWFPGSSELNQYRCEVLHQCLCMASEQQGIFSLTVPTGGGKTVASLAFALKHAQQNHLDRVIYVIPYTSIIEQNADVFRKILGDHNVVEHHSNIDFGEEGEATKENIAHRLATENWDAPVIVTTAVQFFESLYSNRPSRCRKLHNISRSVVIFDEAQMLPACHLEPCVGAIANLTAFFNTTTVLCTATQPALSDIVKSFCPELEIREICTGTAPMYEKFQRVTYRDGGRMSDDMLCRELMDQNQVLCIVNTRKAAQQIFEKLPQEGRFHLSTLMYPEHRKRILTQIRKRLADGKICRVVSTSLIEAGVDVDFPAVYREMAGLDSIIQAAGRCNREGKHPAEKSIVTYYEGDRQPPILQRINIGAAREALSIKSNPGDPETIRRYFVAWRSLMGNQMDKSNTVKYLRNGIRGCIFPFETVAKQFHFIDSATCVVYIPLEEGALLCRKIIEGTADRSDFRQAGQYSVNVYEQHFRELLQAGYIRQVGENAAVLSNPDIYDFCMGLTMQADKGTGLFI